MATDLPAGAVLRAGPSFQEKRYSLMRYTPYGKAINQTSKQPPNTKLLRHLAASLSDAKAIKGVSAQDPAIRGLLGLVNKQVQDLGDGEIDQQTLGDLLATGEIKLIGRVKNAEKVVELQSYQWRRLLRTTRPETVRKLIEGKTLSVQNASPHLFSRIASHDDDWGDLIPMATSHGHVADRNALSKRFRGLYAHPRVAPYAAKHLQDQIAKFPGYYEELSKNFSAKGAVYRVFLINQAGLSLKKMDSIPPRKDGVIAMLKELMQSGHARIKMFAISPNLETSLINHKEIAKTLHDKMR
jgi:hypothetical protein